MVLFLLYLGLRLRARGLRPAAAATARRARDRRAHRAGDRARLGLSSSPSSTTRRSGCSARSRRPCGARARREQEPAARVKVVYVTTEPRAAARSPPARRSRPRWPRRASRCTSSCADAAGGGALPRRGGDASAVAASGDDKLDVRGAARIWPLLRGRRRRAHPRPPRRAARPPGRAGARRRVVHTYHGLPHEIAGLAGDRAPAAARRLAPRGSPGCCTGYLRLEAAAGALRHGRRPLARRRRSSSSSTASPPARMHVVPNGIDVRRREPAEPHDPPVVGTAAILEYRKGIDVLLDAAARGRASRCALEIFGDGSLRGELEAQARALGARRDASTASCPTCATRLARARRLRAADARRQPARWRSSRRWRRPCRSVATRVGGVPGAGRGRRDAACSSQPDDVERWRRRSTSCSTIPSRRLSLARAACDAGSRSDSHRRASAAAWCESTSRRSTAPAAAVHGLSRARPARDPGAPHGRRRARRRVARRAASRRAATRSRSRRQPGRLDELGLDVPRSRCRCSSAGREPRARRGARRRCARSARFRPDVVHAHNPGIGRRPPGSPRCAGAVRRALVSVHGVPEDGLRGRRARCCASPACRSSPAGRGSRPRSAEHGVRVRATIVNGVAPAPAAGRSRRPRARARACRPDAPLLVVAVGRLVAAEEPRARAAGRSRTCPARRWPSLGEGAAAARRSSAQAARARLRRPRRARRRPRATPGRSWAPPTPSCCRRAGRACRSSALEALAAGHAARRDRGARAAGAARRRARPRCSCRRTTRRRWRPRSGACSTTPRWRARSATAGLQEAGRYTEDAMVEAYLALYEAGGAVSPRVSVVMPAYEAAATIGGAVASVLWPDLPRTSSWSSSTTARPTRRRRSPTRYGDPVRVVRQENRGVAAARNRGIARGRTAS